MNKLVKTIQQLAEARGKTIKDVAREAGVGENAIYRWSTIEPKISTLRKVADVLDVDYEVLLINSDRRVMEEKDFKLFQKLFDENRNLKQQVETAKNLQEKVIDNFEIEKVIKIQYRKGLGTKKDPVRIVTSYWNFDGNHLFDLES